MAIIQNTSLRRLRAGKLSIGFGAGQLRTVATPLMAKAAGYDWLFIDMEHGAFSVNEATQLCIAALPTGVTPIVRVCTDALDEATRALDNGALGIVVPHVDTPAQAKRVAEALRFPPRGHRSWGGGIAVYGFAPPGAAEAQEEINNEVMVVAMIETAEAVANADAIAATPGIDVLLIGTSDLTADMGISGQAGHERVQAAYRSVVDACNKHGKFAGLGGIYDDTWAKFYIAMGTRFVLGGSDQMFILSAATARAQFLAGLA
ncbi:HpcH/HpaI aldolase family protein [Limobrevibacterium gyesilva]|uniref:Aldolase/citrate lyase family protein n=1 Tax=Limobrevibacterium gyesilva TaxID=2991712 RepID=A0AA42CH15_9PROT|nr:aldolase/citrate lyase family protein [Limobrevibacterium gyesilva]MCW3474395.1 aldolase/citrate lyase family protein [Limobrevibacterium gyesilva]